MSIPRFASVGVDASRTLFRCDQGTPVLERWTGTAWQAVTLAGTPTGFAAIWPLEIADDQGSSLYLFGSVGNRYVLCRRNGTSWQDTGLCFNACSGYRYVEPHTLLWFDGGDGPHWYAAAYEQGSYAAAVVKWDGSSWMSVGQSSGFIYNLIGYDDGSGRAMYALGDFLSFSGSPSAVGIAKWTGSEWDAVHTEVPIQVSSFGAQVADLGDGPAIYAISTASYNGRTDGLGLNKFNRDGWTHIGHPDPRTPPAGPPELLCMALFSGDRAPALYLGGVFDSFSGVAAHHLVRFDGHSLEGVQPGVAGEVAALISYRDLRGPGLFIHGATQVGNSAPTHQGAAILIGCPNCYANCDLSIQAPTLNINDFICFTQKFSANAPEARCMNDTDLSVNDFVCFMAKFAGRCN